MIRPVVRNRCPLVILAATTLLMVACGGGKEPPKTPLSEGSTPSGPGPTVHPTGDTRDLPLGARIALDSGNALYRAKRYAEALTQYRLAAKHAPEDAAAYFGWYMVAEATKNKPLADSASAAIRARGMMAPTGPHMPPNGGSK